MKKILIVEDERPVARSLELKLVSAGYAVQIAANGEEALLLLAREPFDLVLLDLIMPKMNGFRVLELMKERGITAPVMVTSNLQQAGDMERAKALGAKEYFVKSESGMADIVGQVKNMMG